jgi:hypothetical protein
MKLLRSAIIMMAMSGLAVFPIQAYGQQEVDPDHFDQPAAQAVHKAKPGVHHQATNHAAVHHVKLATRHHAVKKSQAPSNS